MNKEGIKRWFDDLHAYLRLNHATTAIDFLCLENSHRVFNLDESGFPLQGTNSKLKVVGEKGAKNILRLASDTKEQITVLACVSASGEFAKPLVIFPGKKMPRINFADANPNFYDVAYTENGWISSEAFFTWFTSLFHERIKESVPHPIIVFMDGHTSHINMPISEYCKTNNIILYCFPPHASHILQPLDVSVFGPLKKRWNKEVNAFTAKYRVSLTKKSFFTVFDPAWMDAKQRMHGVSGFRKAGLVPFNFNNIDLSKMIEGRNNSTVSHESEASPAQNFNIWDVCNYSLCSRQR